MFSDVYQSGTFTALTNNYKLDTHTQNQRECVCSFLCNEISD